MKLQDIKKRFESGAINKWEYIDEMYAEHAHLFGYAQFLSNTNISAINITDHKVVMTFRDSNIQFICEQNDKRLAPFDTLNFGSYEIEELQMQQRLIEPHFNVFDIGGNFGWYALHVAQKLTSGKVFSFEPIPTTFEKLNQNVELNNMNNIATLNYGLGDENGSFDFYFDPSLSVNASLANVSANNNIETLKCNVKKMDEVSQQLTSKVDFIKCDVEGAELLAFKGGIETIKRDLPIIFTEMLRKWTSKFNYHPNDIIDFLNNLGYACFVIENNKLQAFEKVDEYTTQTNYIFLHAKSHANQIEAFTK
jgi:FkbM family methyltransferase